MKTPSVVAVVAAVLAMGLHLWPGTGKGIRGRTVPPATWAVPAPVQIPAAPAFVREELLEPGPGVASVHVASLAEFAPGRLAACWYGGSKEGARDVGIYLTVRDGAPGSHWSPPTAVVFAQTAERELQRYVKKVGNPLLFSDGQGQLQLLFVSIAAGGWSGSSLNLRRSPDAGKTWSPSRRLVLSPFYNVSELVKNAPIPVEGGGWCVPIYHEMIGKFPELLWLGVPDALTTAVRSRPFGGRTAFQPALVPLGARRALLLCRTAGDRTELFGSRTEDGGVHWSSPALVGLPNSGSGIAAIRMSDGRILLAFNDTQSGRDNLRLAVSADEGVTWRRAATVASEPGADYSSPYLLQTRDGRFHLVFTWKRLAIRHVEFNTAWLDASMKEGTP
ncbi:MAG: exo-alpha-sialidase [Verrucomicrobiales bacterium]|nr:exo-alpha-sialidase [Verrucomicrobiales bacterium]